MPDTPTRKAESEVDERGNFRQKPRLSTPEKPAVVQQASDNCPTSSGESILELADGDKMDALTELTLDLKNDMKDMKNANSDSNTIMCNKFDHMETNVTDCIKNFNWR